MLVADDNAVLENMHACLTFELVMQEENNWMATFDNEDYQHVRRIILSAILNTDMKVRVLAYSLVVSSKKSCSWLIYS